jgi:hypothetical protein
MRVHRFSAAKVACGSGLHAGVILRITLSLAALLIFRPVATAAQAAISGPPARQEVVGRLSGDDVSAAGAIGFESENGRTTALLASGSDLTVRSGQAKVDLPDGGDIILCGPAHLSILKSGPAITIALDYGQVHLQVGAQVQITIYTPLLIVTPEAIGDRERDLTVGFDQKGELCVMALSGAMRIASSAPANPSPNGPVPARVPESSSSATYRIDMPPLTFDASSAAPAPGLAPEAVRVIRESVADQQISFRGSVRPALPPPPVEISRVIPRPRNSKLHFFARLFGIFHHRKAACAGSECAAAAL